VTRRDPKTAQDAQLLIGTKLEFPRLPAGLVARPHLIDLLEQGCDVRLTLISAPAGYGKTTLVAQWLDSDASPPAAWLSLDPLDSDLERFIRYVVAALHGVEEDCLAETEKMLSARNVPPPQYLAESMVFELDKLGRRVVLVLDDYGFIRAPAVHELMSSLVPKLPSTLRLVITSRIDPPFPLSLWRSRHWLHELRAADLRFSRDETGAFFYAANELRLSDEGVARFAFLYSSIATYPSSGFRSATAYSKGPTPSPQAGNQNFIVGLRTSARPTRGFCSTLLGEREIRGAPSARMFTLMVASRARLSISLVQLPGQRRAPNGNILDLSRIDLIGIFVEDRKVGELARLQTAHLVFHPEYVGGIDRHGSQGAIDANALARRTVLPSSAKRFTAGHDGKQERVPYFVRVLVLTRLAVVQASTRPGAAPDHGRPATRDAP
jgi:hypothetical protein